MMVDTKVVYTLNMSDNTKVLYVGGLRHCGWQEQLVGGDHEGW